MNAKIFWFTGLSGAGKTSIAERSKIVLGKKGFSVLILDGDKVRANYQRELSFSEKDIKENSSNNLNKCKDFEQYTGFKKLTYDQQIISKLYSTFCFTLMLPDKTFP